MPKTDAILKAVHDGAGVSSLPDIAKAAGLEEFDCRLAVAQLVGFGLLREIPGSDDKNADRVYALTSEGQARLGSGD